MTTNGMIKLIDCPRKNLIPWVCAQIKSAEGDSSTAAAAGKDKKGATINLDILFLVGNSNIAEYWNAILSRQDVLKTVRNILYSTVT